MLNSTLFAGDSLLQDIADDVGGARISEHENAAAPAVAKVQQALLIWDPNSLPVSGADGVFGPESAAAVHRFKVEELGIDETQVVDDVGPATVERLDEIALAAEVTSVTVFNQFGDVLADVEVLVDDGGTPRHATTDALGLAKLSLISGGTLTLEPISLAAALGDLLDRPVIACDPSDSGDGAVIVPQTRPMSTISPRTHVNIAVVARTDIRVELKTDLEGTVRIVGSGMKVFPEGEGIRVAIQVNDGSAVSAMLDPPPAVPTSQVWFTLTPSDVITTLYARDGDMDALQQALAPIASPPPADPDPIVMAQLVAEATAAFAALPAELQVPETPEPEPASEWTDIDDLVG